MDNNILYEERLLQAFFLVQLACVKRSGKLVSAGRKFVKCFFQLVPFIEKR